jgi:DNA-3-methyladenine glycosylase II
MAKVTTRSIRARLTRQDPKMGRLIRNMKHPAPGRHSDLYLALLQSIMSQQLSGKAADTIIGRFLDLFPGRYPKPRLLAKMSVARLRTAGVSRQKAGYLQSVARFELRHGFDHRIIQRMTDEEVILHLTQIKGVGRWTAEMMLMFPLDRPDVFSAGDLGIQNAMKKLYGLRSQGRALAERMTAIAEAWRPHRSAACKYLWMSRDGD